MVSVGASNFVRQVFHTVDVLGPSLTFAFYLAISEICRLNLTSRVAEHDSPTRKKAERKAIQQTMPSR
jgi:hypothetical protein